MTTECVGADVEDTFPEDLLLANCCVCGARLLGRREADYRAAKGIPWRVRPVADWVRVGGRPACHPCRHRAAKIAEVRPC